MHLRRLTIKFPKSKYYEDSVDRMTYLMNKISEYELHVARFLYEKSCHMLQH